MLHLDRHASVLHHKYEASVWKISSPLNEAKNRAMRKLRAGTVTKVDLVAAGAVQLGLAPGDLAANGCTANGNGCVDIYAVSRAAVMPATHISWFQAVAAARNSVKRLPTNAEWTAATLGTPDPGTVNGTTDCNVSAEGLVVTTGSRSNCVSDAGAMDVVGNLWELVADWVPASTDCPGWGGFSDDFGTDAGVFAVLGDFAPSSSSLGVGFRAAR